MYTIIILAYLVSGDPVITQQQFRMAHAGDLDTHFFDTLEECEAELTLQTYHEGVYDVLYDFVDAMNFEWEWTRAGCTHTETREIHTVIQPTYDYGMPRSLQNVIIDDVTFVMYRDNSI